MASSIHIYQSKELYDKMYKGYREDESRETKLIDLFVRDGKLLIYTNTSKNKENPMLSRSLVHLRNKETKDSVITDECLLVTDGKIRYNVKKNQLEFFPRFLRKPKLSLRVGRFFGETKKKKIKINYNVRYYDLIYDRINLFLEESK